MTVKQESYINALIAKKQVSDKAAGLISVMDFNKYQFSNADASALIAELIACPDKTSDQNLVAKVNKEVHYLLAHKKSAKNAAKLAEIYKAIGRCNITRMTEFSLEEATKIAEVL